MNVLAIETATAVCGSALVRNGEVVAERHIEAQQIHSQKIMGLIDEVLQSSRSNVQNIDGIAVSIGPGSFTALRIGLSTAKGLAYALDKPIIAVSTLEALAMNATVLRDVPDNRFILPLIDARRNEVFAAVYQKNGDVIEETFSPRAIVIDDLYAHLKDGNSVIVTGEGAEKFHRWVVTNRENDAQRFTPLPKEQRVCSAATIGIIGERQMENGKSDDLAALEPLYGKEFYTTMKPQQMVQTDGMV